jgi:hypothetical protein
LNFLNAVHSLTPVRGILAQISKFELVGSSPLALAVLLVFLLCGSGCQTYVESNRSAAGAWQRGDMAGAAAGFSGAADRSKEKDKVIHRLEEGAALRAAGRFQESNRAFADAESQMDAYERRAKVSLTDEAGALLSNQAQLPYEGRIYDKVMLNAYRALNFLQLNDPAAARVEMNRVLRRQDDAVNSKRKRIAREQDRLEAEKRRDPKVNGMEKDSSVKRRMDALYGFLDQYRAEGSYRNPFAVYLRGLFFATHATGSADLEIARHDLTEAAGMVPNGDVIQAELSRIEARFSGKPLSPRVHVIFETGRAPVRDQERIDLPIVLYVGNGDVPYVGAAFPVLRPQFDYLSALNVSAGGRTAQTTLLADMDAIVGREFADELPGVIAKTLLASASKAAVGYTVNRATRKKDDLGGLLAQIATTLYQAAVNVADTRTWTTLPKQIQMAAVELPADRKVRLSGGNVNTEILLQPGNEILLYVKSTSPHAPLLVTQTTLN